MLQELIRIRRHLHRIAELSYREYETTEYIADTLAEWGLHFNSFKGLETGGFCEVGQGRALMFRSDIDGLPIQENPDHNIISQNEGIMHACGHDYHIALGLGLLYYFKLHKNIFTGKLKVIFQPAEEAAPG